MPRFKIDSPKGVHQPPGKYSHAASEPKAP